MDFTLLWSNVSNHSSQDTSRSPSPPYPGKSSRSTPAPFPLSVPSTTDGFASRSSAHLRVTSWSVGSRVAPGWSSVVFSAISPPFRSGGTQSGWSLSTDLGEIEDIAFGVGEGDPVGAVLLVLVETLGAEADHAVELGRPVGGGQVDMQAVLAGPRLGHLGEHQRRAGRGPVHGGEELVTVSIDLGREYAGPEGGERIRVGAVEDDVLEGNGHGSAFQRGDLPDRPADLGSVAGRVGHIPGTDDVQLTDRSGRVLAVLADVAAQRAVTAVEIGHRAGMDGDREVPAGQIDELDPVCGRLVGRDRKERDHLAGVLGEELV